MGLKVGAVGREVAQARAGGLDGFAHAESLVGGEIVHDHDVARGERGSEDLLDVGEERRPVHRAVEHHRRDHAGAAKPGREGRGLPVAVRHGGPAARAAAGATAQSRHLCRGAGLVDEDQRVGIEIELAVEPFLPGSKDVLALLLGGVRGLFCT